MLTPTLTTGAFLGVAQASRERSPAVTIAAPSAEFPDKNFRPGTPTLDPAGGDVPLSGVDGSTLFQAQGLSQQETGQGTRNPDDDARREKRDKAPVNEEKDIVLRPDTAQKAAGAPSARAILTATGIDAYARAQETASPADADNVTTRLGSATLYDLVA